MSTVGTVPDARIPVSAPRARVLGAVSSLGGDGHPVTLAEVAAHLGGHPNTSRQHLDALASAGLLDVKDVARASSGRRPHGYTLTDAGRRALAPAGPDGYREIVTAVAAHHVAKGRGSTEARQIGEVWGERRAAAMAPHAADDPVEAVTDVLAMLGFDPAPAPDGDGLLLRSCPLHGLARENPDFACTLHEGMVKGVVRRLGGKQTVRLLPFAHAQGCRLSIQDPGATHHVE